MLSRKYYVMVAGCVNQLYRLLLIQNVAKNMDTDYYRGHEAGYAQALRDVARELSEEFYGDNPDFSPSRFKDACFKTDK